MALFSSAKEKQQTCSTVITRRIKEYVVLVMGRHAGCCTVDGNDDKERFSSFQLKVSALKCHIFSVRVKMCIILLSFSDKKVFYHSFILPVHVISWKNPRERMERWWYLVLFSGYRAHDRSLIKGLSCGVRLFLWSMVQKRCRKIIRFVTFSIYQIFRLLSWKMLSPHVRFLFQE